jgi:hypothetical protein
MESTSRKLEAVEPKRCCLISYLHWKRSANASEVDASHRSDGRSGNKEVRTIRSVQSRLIPRTYESLSFCSKTSTSECGRVCQLWCVRGSFDWRFEDARRLVSSHTLCHGRSMIVMAKSHWDALAHFLYSIAFSDLYCLGKTMISDFGARKWCEIGRSHQLHFMLQGWSLGTLIVLHLSGRHLAVYRPCSLHIRVFSEVGIFSW